MNNGGFINHDNQENYIIDDEEESESIAYYEFGAHFKYKDLFNSLLKLKIEREKDIDGDESESNKIINNNIFINNNLNLNLFNNNKHKIISRNAQVNNYVLK